MNYGLLVSVLALVAGIVVLIWPKILNYIVAIYLITIGVIGIIDHI